jgi:hypothetical protein
MLSTASMRRIFLKGAARSATYAATSSSATGALRTTNAFGISLTTGRRASARLTVKPGVSLYQLTRCE